MRRIRTFCFNCGKWLWLVRASEDVESVGIKVMTTVDNRESRLQRLVFGFLRAEVGAVIKMMPERPTDDIPAFFPCGLANTDIKLPYQPKQASCSQMHYDETKSI